MGKSGKDGKKKDYRAGKGEALPAAVAEVAEVIEENEELTETPAPLALVETAETPETTGAYACSVCGAKGEPEDGISEENGKTNYTEAKLWARHKYPGSRNQTIMFCKDCKEKEEAAAKKAGQEAPGFAPLHRSLQRDAEYDETGKKAEATRASLLEKQYEVFMRKVREDVVCKRCGKYHGHLMFFKNGGYRITIIDRAMPLKIDREDPTALIEVEPICRDCITTLQDLAKKKGQEFRTFFLGDSLRKADDINAKRSSDAAFLTRGSQQQNGNRRNPNAKMRDVFPNNLKKTGTNGR